MAYVENIEMIKHEKHESKTYWEHYWLQRRLNIASEMLLIDSFNKAEIAKAYKQESNKNIKKLSSRSDAPKIKNHSEAFQNTSRSVFYSSQNLCRTVRSNQRRLAS